MAVSDPGAPESGGVPAGNDAEPEVLGTPPRREIALRGQRRIVPVTPRETVRAATGVARVAWTAASEVTTWTVDTALGVTSTVVRGSMAGTPPREVLAEAESEVRERLRRVLGVDAERAGGRGGVPTLREQGAALLRLSASTNAEHTEMHPAFARILAELTPDEARVLRFLHLDGPQPAIDLRLGRPRTLGADRKITGITVLGEHAGLRFPNRIQQYLTNLRRLGLIEFDREPVGNPNRYQIIEAQAAVRDLLKRSGRGAKVQYRSVLLSGFGADFVRTCLPVVVDGRTAESS